MIGKCNSGISGKSDFSAIITVEDADNKTITATLNGDSIIGIWNGKNYICTVNKEGNWVVSNGSNSQTISITTATNYNVKLGTATLTTLADTFWKWKDYNNTTSGTAYNVNVTCKYTGDAYARLLHNKLYCPFKQQTIFQTSLYVYVLGTYDSQTAVIGYSSSSKGWVAMKGYSSGSSSSGVQSDCQYFHIIDGKDVTNTTLIAYLQTHATQCDSNWNPL